MKTFPEFLEEVIIKDGDVFDKKAYFSLSACKIAAKHYTEQCCKDVLSRARENVTVTEDLHRGRICGYIIDKESITNTEIILP